MIDFHKLAGIGELYFVRHGQTEGYGEAMIKGRSDPPLSEEGIAQAKQTAEWFSGHPVSMILSSPLRRARETARIIADRLNIPEVRLSDELIELDTGIFTGISQQTASEKYPAEFGQFQRQSWDGVPGAEKSASLYARSAKFWKMLIELARGENTRIISVAHKGILQWILRLPFQARAWMPLYEIDFCGIYRLSFNINKDNYFLIWDLLNFTAWED